MPKAPPRTSPRGRLFRKYALLINALVGTLLLASAALSLSFSYRESRDHLVALQFEQAQGAAARIEQYIADIEQQLGWTALSGMNAGGDALEARRIDYLKLLRQVPAITEAAWLDAQGREQLRVSRLTMDTQGQAVDRSAEPLFTDPAAGRVWRGPVSFRKQTEPYMTIARRAGPSSGGGVTVVEVNLKFVWDVVARIRPGEAGLAYAVDQTGALIAHPDISLVLKQTNLSALPQVAASLATPATEAPHLGPLASAMLDGKAIDLAGQPVLSSHARLASLGWTVFVESPRSQAYAPLYASLLRLGLLLAAGLVISVAASAWLARTLVRPIRQLQDGAARVAAGDLDHRLTVHTRDELEDLAGEFNRMAGELKGSYAGLEDKVAHRTAELAQALDVQHATTEVLQVISSSVSDTAPVFDKILDSCQHLFATDQLAIFFVRPDGQVHIGAFRGSLMAGARESFPRPLDETTTGLAIRQRRPVIIASALGPDVQAATRAFAARAGDHSAVNAPMLWEGTGIGSIVALRQPPRPFTAKEAALLATFADQAVIAIRNAQLVQEIRDKSDQLEVASRHKSEFLANMSHELRTPLNAIIGFSEVLAEQMFGEVNQRQLEYLNDIHASGHHLLQLINDILDLAKIEAGRMELELAPCDLAQVLESAVGLIRERATRQGLQLHCELAPGLGSWTADARKLKQAVLNLLSNAVKFTPEGGQVTLRAQRVHEGTSCCAEIMVIDTGVGIAPVEQALVFEEFRQVGTDPLRKAEGTGLGLALVRRFVELHGGTIRLDSALGQGATFVITMPERSRPATHSAATAPPSD
jgi:signal transduction histidine kinase